MTLLHAHFHLRNIQAFQRALDSITNANHPGSGGLISSSGGKSSSKSSQIAIAAELNAKDWLGRTVLHLAAATPDGVEYTRALLRHQQVNVNMQDAESGWTALHRALYNGNLPAVIMLMQRSDLDITIRDVDGYTALDIYNSTVEGTKPSGPPQELFTWGANRNAALGVGTGDDRTYPDHVDIEPKEPIPSDFSLDARFSPIRSRQVQMSKLHTVVVTSEPFANLRLCGFGGGGRLGGPGQHTQYDLRPLPQLPPISFVSVAVGQDHTLALSEAGEIYSWGLNRFSQLGYLIEKEAGKENFGRKDEPIQSVPRKIQGPLRKEVVVGVAASRSASACWTRTELFTWGTNAGQLGYEKAAQPVQIVPRKVTKISRPVMSVALSDNAMAILLDSQDVICLWNDWSTKISFSGTAFPSGIQQPYRPPQAVKATRIAKITCCDDTFAALSSTGELYTFTVPASTVVGADRSIRPQRVWALKRQWSPIQDVGVGVEGSIIVSTESGHVFVRSRTSRTANTSASKTSGAAATKAFKFQRVPYIQRVVNVVANATGAYGALKASYKPASIPVEGNILAQDMMVVRPFASMQTSIERTRQAITPSEDDEDDEAIVADIEVLRDLCSTLSAPNHDPSNLGADISIKVAKGGMMFGAHRAVLFARCPILKTLFTDGKARGTLKSESSKVTMTLSRDALEVSGCHPLTVLVLLNYLYVDELVAVWDRRVYTALNLQLSFHKVQPAVIKAELGTLASMLELKEVVNSLEAASKRDVRKTLVRDMTGVLRNLSDLVCFANWDLRPDVILEFQDHTVACFSVVLCARSVLFRYLFGDKDWTQKRYTDGRITINMKHLRWHIMQHVIRFLCGGEDQELFTHLDFAQTGDEAVEFLFEVIAAANELHLDRLLLICASAILDRISINNVCYILTEATHFHIVTLMDRAHTFIAINLETLLEINILDVLEPRLVKQLGVFIAQLQNEKSPQRRPTMFVDTTKHADWLAQQDIPGPFVPTAQKQSHTPSRTATRRTSRLQLTPAKAAPSATKSDDVFDMDEMDGALPAPSGSPDTAVPPRSAQVWRAASSPRVDMRAVMASEAASTAKLAPQTSRRVSGPSQLQRKPSELLDGSRAGGSGRTASGPWKVTAVPPSTEPPPQMSPTRPAPLMARQPPPAPATPPRVPGLGPVITPTRRPQGTTSGYPGDSPRRSSQSSKAWSAPAPMKPAPAASVRGMSFVAIQQMEIDQVDSSSKERDKRSLLEIQEEEEAKRQEEDFMKWWQAEEERTRLESLPQSTSRPKASKSSGSSAKRKGGKPKKKAAP